MPKLPCPDIPAEMNNLYIVDDEYLEYSDVYRKTGEELQICLNQYRAILSKIVDEKIIEGLCATKLNDFSLLVDMLGSRLQELTDVLAGEMTLYIQNIDADDVSIY